MGPKGECQWEANNSIDRLTQPLVRNSEGTLVPVSWNEAMELIVRKFSEQLKAKGPSSVALYGSGQHFLEDYYTLAKITRAGLRTHNTDSNTRLCMATAEWACMESFGSDAPPSAKKILIRPSC